MKKTIGIALLTMAVLLGGSIMVYGEATVKLAGIFQDGAVLQQGKTIPVWGWTDPDCSVTGELNGIRLRTASNDRGYFILRFPAMEAGGPYELKVSAKEAQTCVQSVWIGEVFLFSGQSNMEFTLGTLGNYKERAANGEFSNPDVSCFVIPADPLPVRKEDVAGRWITANGEACANVSAFAFFFGNEIAKTFDCKVGIVCAARGGSGIECWISPQGVLNSAYLREKAEQFFIDRQNPGYFEDAPADALYPDGDRLLVDKLREMAGTIENTGLEMGWAESDYDDMSWDVMELPDSWTVAGHNCAGVFWYRKDIEIAEENAGKDITLSLGALDKGDITYFNGVETGRTGDGIDMGTWNTPRVYTVPGELVKAGRNTIAVRVCSSVSIALDGGFMGPAEDMFWQQEGGVKESLATEWRYTMEQNFGLDGALLIPVAAPGLHNTVSTLFNNKIYPLLPYAFRSIVWYQGECNAIPESAVYDVLLETLIKDWRYQFCDPGLDFMVIQLPGWHQRRRFSCGSTWAAVRENQLKAALANNAAIVVTTDTGDVVDIHPHDKDIVAARAAAMMTEKIKNGSYPETVLPVSAKLADNSVEITFSAGNISAAEGFENGFAIVDTCGDVFYPEFTIAGNTVILDGIKEIPSEGTVYFNWSTFPVGKITDSNGYPIPPFRIDFK